MKKVYLINQEGTNYYKIGITKKKVKERIKELQTGNGSTLILIIEFTTNFCFKLETALHLHYKRKRINSEWFELSEEDIKVFIPTCELYENNFKILKDSGNPFFNY